MWREWNKCFEKDLIRFYSGSSHEMPNTNGYYMLSQYNLGHGGESTLEKQTGRSTNRQTASFGDVDTGIVIG